MTTSAPSSCPDDQSAARRPRVRLTPEVRRQQILDAALEEFSLVGVEGATMERIAQRVGLTKAGVYAHFKGKEEIFETLLHSNLFRPTWEGRWLWQDGATLEEAVDRYLEQSYAEMRNPRLQATLRLLIAESARSAPLIQQCYARSFDAQAAVRQQELDGAIAQGVIADNPVSRDFAVTAAPTLLAMITLMVAGAEAAQPRLAQIRAAHRHMLLALFGSL